MEDIIRTDYHISRPGRRHAALEHAIEQMVREDVSPQVAQHWRTKASALLTIAKVDRAQERWRKERTPGLIFKVFDYARYEHMQELRRRARKLRAQAERLLGR